MCLMCVEILKDRITCLEVFKAGREFKIEDDHYPEFAKLLKEKFTPQEMKEAFDETYDGEPLE